MKTAARSLFAILLLLLAIGAQAEDQYFDSNGVTIRYIVEGKGEPVVLIHGFTSNLEANWGFPGTIKALAGKYRVIALDCRGHGKSDKPHDPKKYGKEMGEDVVRLMDHLKIKRAHIAGYSMGAFLAYGLAFDHPDRFLTLTLGAGGGLGSDDQGANAQHQSYLTALADSLDEGRGLGPLILMLTPPGQPKPTEERIKSISDFILAGNDPHALAAVARGGLAQTPQLEKSLMDAKLKAWSIPTLALVGSDDPLKGGLEALKARMDTLQPTDKKMQLVVIPGANHATAPNTPEFLKNFQEFLDHHPAESGK